MQSHVPNRCSRNTLPKVRGSKIRVPDSDGPPSRKTIRMRTPRTHRIPASSITGADIDKDGRAKSGRLTRSFRKLRTTPLVRRLRHKRPTSRRRQLPRRKRPSANKPTADATARRDGSKSSQVIAMLKREGGTTLEEIMTKMGWQSIQGRLVESRELRCPRTFSFAERSLVDTHRCVVQRHWLDGKPGSSRTRFRDRPETVRLHRGIGVHLHPGILFAFAPEERSESSRNRVHVPPESPGRHRCREAGAMNNQVL